LILGDVLFVLIEWWKQGQRRRKRKVRQQEEEDDELEMADGKCEMVSIWMNRNGIRDKHR